MTTKIKLTFVPCFLSILSYTYTKRLVSPERFHWMINWWRAHQKQWC